MAEHVDDSCSVPPRVFVSYTHETPDHKRWVSNLASHLRGHGVDATLDQWDLPLGADVTLFMEKGIRDADRVLLVCTPTYARKANEGEGGVGYERLVVTGELAAKTDTNKFICVLRVGSKSDSIPTFAQTRVFVDFTDDSTYEVSLDELLRDILKAPSIPKPPIGANPYKETGEVILSTTLSGIQRTSVAPSSDVEELYARASRLLRDKDLLGWKQLVRNVRGTVPERLRAWREEAECAVAQRRSGEDEWYKMLHNACRAASPIILLALSAVDSEIEGLADQRGFLDDLTNVPEWERSGIRRVIEAPLALAYVFHSILGAFLIASNRPREAIRLLRTKVPIEVGSLHVGELWQSPEMMGWAESLGHDVDKGWGFLNSMWDNHPWLGHFFVRRQDFLIRIRAYNLLAGMLELASKLRRGGDFSSFSVPPLFLTPLSGGWDVPSVDRLLSLALPDRAMLKAIADEYGCGEKQFREAWSGFYSAWMAEFAHLFGLRPRLVARGQFERPELP